MTRKISLVPEKPLFDEMAKLILVNKILMYCNESFLLRCLIRKSCN